MAKFDEITDLQAFGLEHSPLVESWDVEVPRPSLRDNSGLADRLVRAVQKAADLDEIDCPLSLVADLNGLLVESDYRVRAACRRLDAGRGRLVHVWPSPGPKTTYGLAVDIGSTTLCLALVDMDQPAVVDQITLPNPQIEYGADILTRVHFSERPGGMERLVGGLREAINQGAAALCDRHGLTSHHLAAAAMAGNTTMTHLLLGLPLRTVIREPYVPVINRVGDLTAGQVGLNLAPEAPVLILPNKGAYFGGDLMAGLVVSGMGRAEFPCLMVDVGTNAEVVLGQKDWLIGAAGAAGPALEGGVATMGMTAGPGAIDRVRIDRRTKAVTFRTIADAPPRGICGSGLIDLLAELYLSGLIDMRGRLTIGTGNPQRLETEDGPAFVVAPAEVSESGGAITISEVDLDILLRSKAAMYTILATVVKSVGIAFEQLDRFFVAGTFGQYIDPRMAVAVGMVPDIPLDRFVSLGNSSLTGAALTLTSARARREVSEVWRKLTYLEMNVNQDLMNRFSAARFIPHTNRSLFPSVGTIII